MKESTQKTAFWVVALIIVAITWVAEAWFDRPFEIGQTVQHRITGQHGIVIDQPYWPLNRTVTVIWQDDADRTEYFRHSTVYEAELKAADRELFE